MMSVNELDNLLDDALGDGKDRAKRDERPRIMIVDDNRSVCEALEAVLGDRYQVTSHYDALSAVAALDESIHAVLLDIKMEGVDGFQCFEMMRKRFTHLPIIFHSAYQDLRDPYEVMNALKPFGYLQKGASEAQIVEHMERAIEYRRRFIDSERKLRELTRQNELLQARIKEREERIREQRALIGETTGRFTRTSSTSLPRPSQPPGSRPPEPAPALSQTQRLHGLGSIVLRLDAELEACRKERRPLLCCVAEIDAFDALRGRDGVSRSDDFVEKVAVAVLNGKPGPRLVGRSGDARVIIVVPGIGSAGAGAFMTQLKTELASVMQKDEGSVRIRRPTVSCGAICIAGSASPDARKVLALAERALDNARRRGPGSVVTEMYGADVRDGVK